MMRILLVGFAIVAIYFCNPQTAAARRVLRHATYAEATNKGFMIGIESFRNIYVPDYIVVTLVDENDRPIGAYAILRPTAENFHNADLMARPFFATSETVVSVFDGVFYEGRRFGPNITSYHELNSFLAELER